MADATAASAHFRTTASGIAAPLLLSAAIFMWAGNFIAGRAVRGTLDPLLLNFWRWALALLILVPLAWPRLGPAQVALVRTHWRLLLALGATGVAACNVLLYLALAHTPALNALLLAATMPAAIALLARAVLGERIPVVRSAGIATSLAGAAVLVARGDLRGLLGLQANPGDAVMVAAVMVWAIYTVLLRRRPAGMDPIVLLAVTAVAGVAMMLPLWLWLGAKLPPADTLVLAALLYVALFASVLAFLAWNRGVALVGAARAGAYANLSPVFGAILAVALLGETVALHHLAGAVLVFAGLLLPALWSRLRAAPVPSGAGEP